MCHSGNLQGCDRTPSGLRRYNIDDFIQELQNRGIPKERIVLRVLPINGRDYYRITLLSGNTDPNCHWLHKEKYYYTFNERTLDWGTTWYHSHAKEVINVRVSTSGSDERSLYSLPRESNQHFLRQIFMRRSLRTK